MSDLQTVTNVTKTFGVSTRMLRHYERMGLLQSQRVEGYAYRVYDEEACARIKQIIILRKLRIPLKQIAVLLGDDNAVSAIDLFMQNINELDEEIASLSTIRDILQAFVAKLKENVGMRLSDHVFSDKKIMSLVAPLSLNKFEFKENTMTDLNQASKRLNKLIDKDVRVVYLPPATVASFHAVGNDEQGRIPEDQHNPVFDAFEKELAKIKPDFRHYGFNHSVSGVHGYERWVTIPDDMDVPPPFTKKHFPGGLYAASVLPVDNFEEGWSLLEEWVVNSEKYEPVSGDLFKGCLEEHSSAAQILTGAEMYIDLLLPVQLRSQKKKTAQLGHIEGSEKLCGYKASLLKKEGFTIAGYTKIQLGDIPHDEFHAELARDGRLERLNAALKPGAALMIFKSYDGECAKKAGGKDGAFYFRQTVCADIKDFIDPDAFITEDIFTQTLAPKRWIEFEFPRKSYKKFSNDGAQHSHVQKLGWRFSGSGHFDVYHDGEILLSSKNKNSTMQFWMPVVPMK